LNDEHAASADVVASSAGASSTIVCALNDERAKSATTNVVALSAASLNAIVCAPNHECAESAAM